MNVIQLYNHSGGSHPPIQTWDSHAPPSGYAEIAPGVDTSAMQTHAGFVNLTIEDGIVTAITGNDEAHQAWLASLPPPEPMEPTEMELAQQDITDLQLSDIEQGQQMTDLELMILGGGTNVRDH